jgi:hydroxymethylbilane synthase
VDFRGSILARDGSEYYEAALSGNASDAAEIGRAAGREIRARAPAAFLQELGLA